MTINSLELENIGPFRFRPSAVGAVNDFKVRIVFDQEANLFVGPNNVGKSTILNAVNLLTESWSADFCARFEQSVRFPQNAHSATLAMQWTNPQNELLRFESDYGSLSSLMARVQNNARLGGMSEHRPIVPPRSFSRRQNAGSINAGSINAGSIIGLYPELPSRPIAYDEWETRKSSDFGYVEYATHTIDALDRADNVLAAIQQGRNAFERDVFDVTRRIVAQITEGFSMQITIDRGPNGARRDIVADQTPDGRVSVSDLSLGTRYVLGWVFKFVVTFARHHSSDSRWRERYGILIVDEIDAHLHPSWQRRIIPTMKEYFPNVQIFASTHSPMMVAGLKTGQVHMLNRDTSGMVTWRRNKQDIIGWTADEIYRTFMDIDDPTDERTARDSEELRQLRQKYSRTREEEDRLQDLRTRVNQDLLAGGHTKAQQERFDAMMGEYLRSRRTDSPQNGG